MSFGETKGYSVQAVFAVSNYKVLSLSSALLVVGLTILFASNTQAESWRRMINRADSLAESGDPTNLDLGIDLTKNILRSAVADVGELDSTSIMVMQLLGVYLTYRGDYLEADSIFQKVLDLSLRVYGEQHEIVVRTLNNRAVMLQYSGLYDSSLALQREALELTKKYRGENHTDVAVGLNNMAMNYASLGMEKEREESLKLARDIWARAFGDSNRYTATAINNLGDLFLEQGKLEQAEEYYETAMAMRRASHDTSSTHWLDSFISLSDIQIKKSALDSALALCNAASKVADQVLTETDPYFITINEQLAQIAFRRADYDEAKRLYLKCISDRSSRYGPDDPDVKWEEIAQIYRLQGQPQEAFAACLKAFTTKWRSYQLNSDRLTEREALRYFQNCRRAAFDAASAYFEIENPDLEVTRNFAEILLTCKGSVSDQFFSRHNDNLSMSDPAKRSLVLTLREKRSQYSELYYSVPSGSESSERNHRLDSLAHVCEALERELALASPARAATSRAGLINMEEVRAAIPAKASFIEYFEFNSVSPQENRSIPKYLALVLCPNVAPRILPLGIADSIETLVYDYHDHLEGVARHRVSPGKADQANYDQIASGLYDVVLRPAMDLVKQSDELVIAPEGLLNTIAFATLKGNDKRYLVERYSIRYVMAGRDLLNQREESESTVGLLALGDPDFDANGDPPTEIAISAASRYTTVAAYTYNQRSACDQFYTRTIQRIPSTRAEIEDVSNEWNKTKSSKATVLIGARATEANFKTMATGKSILYLATHGYFLGGGCDSAVASVREERPSENPLLLGGLILAGANKRGYDDSKSAGEDGILTADEVSMLDLRGTELVVLSACESGLGRTEAGEGVYGLRRAFQLAGAKTIVSTLWKIDDRSTSEMMASLFTSQSASIPNRIRELQLAQIQKLRKEGRTDHPYTWGAFVVTGN